MKFKRIKFKNYRCFVEGELFFQENEGKNINLIIGSNGAGKTEILFAFWWVLYGFNFQSLKNKEATPYALNSSLYKALKAGTIQSAECSVLVELEENGRIYVIERSAEYKKEPKKITDKESQSIRYYKENHELSVPIRDEEEVRKLLTRIIPKAILNGIVFDGERMKQLSSVDEASVKAIAGVINDITNVELVNLCRLTFEQIRRGLNTSAKKIAKQNGNTSLASLINEISQLEETVTESRNKRAELVKTLAEKKAKSQELSLQLDEIKEAKLLEQQRRAAKADLEKEEGKKNTYIHNFLVSIANGYIACCDPIFFDVETLLTEYDVPAELTVPAVKNILLRPKCICGSTWTPQMRGEVEILKSKLPPDNINSAMGEMVRQLRINGVDKKKSIKSDFDVLKACNENIKTLKDTIASISTQITKSGSEQAEEIEKQYASVQDDIISLTAEIKMIDGVLPGMEKTLESKKKQKEAMSQNMSLSLRIAKESAFVDKCILALDRIEKTNRVTALQHINRLLQEAYALLSDDYNLGRRIYIVQYDDSARYQLVTYLEHKYEEAYATICANGSKKQMEKLGYSEEEIRETVIRQCALSHSTGQSKMNTLAFVKAILDYANDPSRNSLFEVVKDYPLLIDAPFGDIFDTNLQKSADNLHLFSNQVILMLAKESYQSVAQYITPYVSTVHVFTKETDADHSTIVCGSVEGL